MANKTVTEFVLAIRQHSNTVRRQVVTDTEVLARGNDGLQNLYDLIDGAHGTYFCTPYDFALVGGYGQNTAALPADHYHAKGLDRFLGATNGPKISVDALASFAERNSYGRRWYDIVAGNVVVGPPTLAAGNYELLYIPKCPVLAAPIVVAHKAPTLTPIIVTPADDNVVAATGIFSFEVGFFGPEAVDGCLVIAGAANAGNNGTFRIDRAFPFLASTQLGCVPGFYVDETFGGGVTASWSNAPIDGVLGAVFTLGNATLDSSYVGAAVTITGSAISNSTWIISAVLSPTTFTTTLPPQGDEIFGTGVVASIQPVGTLGAVPDYLNDWVLFAELDAAVTILDKQNLDSSKLQGRREQQVKRIDAAARARRDQPYQVPRRPRRAFRNGGFC